MKLRTKVPLLFFIILLGVVLVIHYILNAVVLQSYAQLELQEAEHNADRLHEALLAEYSWLEAKSGDWANWDDAYSFVQHPNQEFITSNIQNQAFESLQINLMMFVRLSGEVVQEKEYSLDVHQEVPVNPWWKTSGFLTTYPAVKDPLHNKLGIVMVGDKPMIIVFRQILTSSAEGPATGMLMFGKYLNSSVVQKLSSLVKYPLAISDYSDSNLAPDFQEAKEAFQRGSDIYLLTENENDMDIYVLIRDINGNPSLILEEKNQRNIYQYGKRNTLLSELLIIGIGLSGGIVIIIVLMNHLVLSRLARLMGEVQNIGPSGSLSTRVGKYGSDELGQLATTFNSTLSHLEQVTNEALYQELQSKSLLSVMEEGVILTNEQGKISYVNSAWEKLFGYGASELHNQELSHFITLTDLQGKELPSTYLDDIATKNDQGNEIRVWVEGKGKKAAVLVGSASIIVQERFKGLIRIFHDITGDVEMQKQKDDFFSIASHELRTPLTLISGTLDNVLHGFGGSTISSKDISSLGEALSSSDRLIRLVNDYLSVSRLDQGRLTLTIKPVDMCSLLDTIGKTMESLFAEREIRYSFQCAAEKVSVLADEDKLKEVLLNLLGNSAKFTKQGEISITQRMEQDHLITEVRDTGIGIAKDKQHLLFNRFQQAMDETIRRDAGGTGLGLYISREFVRRMGGDMWLVTSDLHRGATFAFSLPIAQQSV